MRAAVATASLIEVFVSFQGEGPKVGTPTLFVRGAGCPLRCTYCDTVASYEETPGFAIRDLGGIVVAELANPIGAADLVAALPPQVLDGVRWVSFTGGEPLRFPAFGAELFAAGRRCGLRTLLETAAVDPAALGRVLPVTDHLAMDWKLPSTLRGQADTGRAHERCVGAAVAAGVETSVKIVLTPAVSAAELDGALERLGRFKAGITLVLQPVTPCLDEAASLPARLLLDRARAALGRGFDLRVLPQVHPLLGLA